MRIGGLALLLLAASPFGNVASAQSNEVARVIVLRFAGTNADAAREAVMVGIASYVELVDEEHAVVTAEEMGVDVSTPEGMAEVVVQMGISLVIAGSVDGRRGPTTIQVVNPRGELLSSREAPNPRDDTHAPFDSRSRSSSASRSRRSVRPSTCGTRARRCRCWRCSWPCATTCARPACRGRRSTPTR